MDDGPKWRRTEVAACPGNNGRVVEHKSIRDEMHGGVQLYINQPGVGRP